MSDAHCRNADSLLHGLVAIFTEQEARGGDTGWQLVCAATMWRAAALVPG
jgi:hypothetical protein